MDLDAAREFLRENHRCVLSTRRSDGHPQMSPVVAAVDGEGRITISTREAAMKTRNVRRDPAVSLCVMNDRFFGSWMQVDGIAEVIALPEAMEGLLENYRSIAGEHEDWDEYRRSMERERRVLLAITPTRAGPDRAG
jgi:PPOX class probable F420-dependent enzyme